MVLITPAQQFIAKVFGHLDHRLDQVEHLTPILDQRIGLGAKVCPALECRSLMPGLARPVCARWIRAAIRAS